jgi:hypothetical protein
LRTVVLGKKIENKYKVISNQKEIKDNDGNLKTVYTDRPSIDKKPEVKEWVELCSYEGEPRYNYRYNGFRNSISLELNISETEYVSVYEEIFRADLNEVHLHTNKAVEIIDIDKEESLSILDEQIRAFNKMMIESNHKLKSYCDLHKLSYEDTDCIELFNLVFPDNEYVIEDGVMKVKEKEQSNLFIKKADMDFFDISMATSDTITSSIVPLK